MKGPPVLGILSKSAALPPAVIEFDDRARTLQRPGAEPVQVRAKSFAAFVALAQSHPDALSKDDLIGEVWGRTAVSDDSVVQCIADIRRALGDSDHRIVQTVPGEGYRLTEPAMPVGSATQAVAGDTARPVLWAALIAAVLGAAAVVAAVLLWSRADGPETRAADDPSGPPKVAVLDFQNLAPDPRWDRLARGLTNDVTLDLKSPGTLTVLSKDIVDRADRSQADLIEAYSALGAGYVVTGTIQADGDDLRVSAELIDTSTGQVIWDRRWARTVDDFFAIQDEIVADIANALANRWTGVIVEIGDTRHGTLSLTAYDLVQQAAEKFDLYTPDALAAAEALFWQATQEDPEFASAWAWHSFALAALAPMVSAAEASEMMGRRISSARTGRHADEGDPMATLAAAWLAAERGNRVRVDERIEAAAKAARTDAHLSAMLALQAALITDRYVEAVAWGQTALRLSPEAPAWYRIGPGFALFLMEDYAAAADLLRRAPQADPGVVALLAAAEARAGNAPGADAARAVLRTRHPDLTAAHYLASVTLWPEAKADTLRAAFQEAGVPPD